MEKQYTKSPPKWANRFLEWYCADHLVDEIQGDLSEAFYYRSRELGEHKAKWWFVWDVMRFFRPSSFARRQHYNGAFMLKSHFIFAARRFRKDRQYALLNLLGLIIGIAASLFIGLYLFRELSYDNFHEKKEVLFRVPMDSYASGELRTKSATVFAGVGPALEADFPEVITSVTTSPFASGTFAREGQTPIRQKNVTWATGNFFEVFDFPLSLGTPSSVLKTPNAMVISQKVAAQYFPDSDPLGKTLTRNGGQRFVVTGIMQDSDLLSHMPYDIVLNIRDFDDYQEGLEDWGWSDFYCYVQLTSEQDAPALQNKLAGYLTKYKQAVFERYNVRQELWLQKLTDIHLHSDLSSEMQPNGSIQQVYFLAIVGLLILIVAWVNFVNLNTARATKRIKEVGMRKVLGANRGQLILQVVVEALVFNLIATAIGFLLVYLLIPVANDIFFLELKRNQLFQGELLLALTGCALTGGFISGIYPALIISSFKVGQTEKARGNGFRKVLVVGQLSVSMLLLLGASLAVKQLAFMRSQSLGMDTDQVLVINGADLENLDELADRSAAFKNSLGQMPGLVHTSAANMVPGIENYNLMGFTTDLVKGPVSCHYAMVSQGYFDCLGVDVVAGRQFDDVFATDTKGVILNQAALKLLGFSSAEEAIGQTINRGRYTEGRIVGIIGDYHQRSLQNQVDPMVFFFDDQGDETNYWFVKLGTADYQAAIESLQTSWEDIFPEAPFSSFFLDDFFNQQYRSDQQFNLLFISFTGLSLFIACLGLFGMISFAAEQSKKEISIRKVLGASELRVVILLARSYAWLILLAVLISFPVAYYLMREWLQDFAYQTTIDSGLFVFSGLAITLMALLTVCLKSLVAANTNPVNALREE